MDYKNVKPLLADVMGQLDYQLVSGGTFKARWSSPDVEHYLYWRMSSTRGFLICEFGFRNPLSEQYAQDCASLYAGLSRKNLRAHYRRCNCSIRLSNARVTSNASHMVIGFIRETELEFRALIRTIVGAELLPAIRPIESLNDLYGSLERDDKVCPWWATPAVLRAPKLVKLGKMIGVSTRALEGTLLQRKDEIGKVIGLDCSPQDYIQKILTHADDATPPSEIDC